jgi:hypothetical protein
VASACAWFPSAENRAATVAERNVAPGLIHERRCLLERARQIARFGALEADLLHDGVAMVAREAVGRAVAVAASSSPMPTWASPR